MVNTLFKLMGTKGTGLAKDINSFQQAGLARTIVAAYQVKRWMKIDRGTLEISEIRQTKLTDRHITLPRLKAHRHNHIKA